MAEKMYKSTPTGDVELTEEEASELIKWREEENKRLADEELVQIRTERNRLLAETDWMTFSDTPTMSEANKTYRQKLRDLPSDQSSKKKYADIIWPSKP